jgi:hypothetical protein
VAECHAAWASTTTRMIPSSTEANDTRPKRMPRLPDNATLSAKLFQVGKVGPTTGTRSAVQHFGQPVHHALFVKGVRTFLVGRPHDLFANFVVAQANSAAVWHRVEGCLVVAEDEVSIGRGFQVGIDVLRVIFVRFFLLLRLLCGGGTRWRSLVVFDPQVRLLDHLTRSRKKKDHHCQRQRVVSVKVRAIFGIRSAACEPRVRHSPT